MAAHTLKLLPGYLLSLFEEDIVEDLIVTAKQDGYTAAMVQLGLIVLKFGLHIAHRCKVKSSRSDKG